MLRVEAMTERMGHDVIGHHPLMPGVSKTAQAFIATRCLEDSLHVTHDDNPFVRMQDTDADGFTGPQHPMGWPSHQRFAAGYLFRKPRLAPIRLARACPPRPYAALGKGVDPFAKLHRGPYRLLELAAQHLANLLVFLVG